MQAVRNTWHFVSEIMSFRSYIIYWNFSLDLRILIIIFKIYSLIFYTLRNSLTEAEHLWLFKAEYTKFKKTSLNCSAAWNMPIGFVFQHPYVFLLWTKYKHFTHEFPRKNLTNYDLLMILRGCSGAVFRKLCLLTKMLAGRQFKTWFQDPQILQDRVSSSFAQLLPTYQSQSMWMRVD